MLINLMCLINLLDSSHVPLTTVMTVMPEKTHETNQTVLV
jgi:hypothetical protein